MWPLKRIALTLLLLLFTLPVAGAEKGPRVLFEFDKPKAEEAWRNVNDGVMGGVSEGKFRVTDGKTMEFYGNLSLENNGGFASVRCRPTKFDLSKFDGVGFRVRGDGRTYYFNIQVPSLLPAFSYRAKFETQAGKWQEIRIPFKDFRATSFGRELRGVLDPSKVQSVGFLLADKKAGPFKLEVDWIRAVGKVTRVP
jgi:monofunctional biosynthetic peptidoglycan transglycosylase